MAKKFVSPGVFTTEIDQSFLATGLGTIGAVVIGRTQKGPAFKPTVVTDFTDFQTRFGDLDPTMMVPYAAQAYLKNASQLTVVRVLGTKANGQYGNVTNGSQLNLFGLAGSGSDVLAVVAAPVGVTATISDPVSVSGTAATLALPSGTVLYTAIATGTAGNQISVAYVSSTSSVVSVSGSAIKVYVDVTTADYGDVVRLVNASVPASALVSATLLGNSGTLVTPVTATNLVSGTDVKFSPNFGFSFTSGALLFAGTASLNPAAPNYIGKVWNTDPTKVGKYGHFLYKNFQWAGSGTGAPYALSALSATTTASFDQEYFEAETPVIVSQDFGGQRYNLFRFETLGAGEAANTDVKVTITNIKPSAFPTLTPYGTFDVAIRVFGDTDGRPVTVETFTGCDLNPKSQNYLARRIGDQVVVFDVDKKKNIVNGTYKNASKYVRVIMDTDANAPADALPWGHLGYPENTVSGGTPVDVPYVQSNLDASSNVVPGTAWGLKFSADGVEDRLKSLAVPGAVVVGSAFDLGHVSGTSSQGFTWAVYNVGFTGTNPAGPLTTSSLDEAAFVAAVNGFTVAFYGGFDGFDMTKADPLAIPNGSPNTYIGVVSQKFGVDMIANPDEIDLNLLALPGTTWPAVVDYARQVCNERADCMFIMDVAGSSVSDVVGQLNNRSIDDNYTACYYPDLKLSDNINNVIVEVKPSTIMLGVYAFSDRVGQVFFAPAGLNRGGLNQFGVVDVTDRLTHEDRNDLYEARINPIATFPNEGIVAFGQKTLQAKPSALDRVNVRRLLIYAKKTIASAAKLLLFEPNNPSTWNRFLNTVNPILEKIRQDQGLERFKVVMDSTVNTPDVIDRNVMRGKIFLQPTKSAEFIDLQFVITATGVSFEE